MYPGIIYAEAEPRHHVKSAIKKELIPNRRKRALVTKIWNSVPGIFGPAYFNKEGLKKYGPKKIIHKKMGLDEDSKMNCK